MSTERTRNTVVLGFLILGFTAFLVFTATRPDGAPDGSITVTLDDGTTQTLTEADVRTRITEEARLRRDVEELRTRLESAERAERSAVRRATEAERAAARSAAEDGDARTADGASGDGETGTDAADAPDAAQSTTDRGDAIAATDWPRVSRAVARRVRARSERIGHVEAAELRKEFGYLEARLREIAAQEELPGPADAVLHPPVARRLLDEVAPELMPSTAAADRGAIVERLLASTAAALADRPLPLGPLEHQIVRLRAVLETADAYRGRVDDAELRNVVTLWLESSFNRSTSLSMSKGTAEDLAQGVATTWARRIGREASQNEDLLPIARPFVDALDRTRGTLLTRLGEEHLRSVFEALRGEGARALVDWLAQLRAAAEILDVHATAESTLAALLGTEERAWLRDSGLFLWLVEVAR